MPARSTRGRTEREARRRSRAYAVRRAVHADRGRRRRRDDLIAAIVFVVLVGLATGAQIVYFAAGPGAPRPAASARPSTSASATPPAPAPTNPSGTPAATPSASVTGAPSPTP